MLPLPPELQEQPQRPQDDHDLHPHHQEPDTEGGEEPSGFLGYRGGVQKTETGWCTTGACNRQFHSMICIRSRA
jgi:hypothetical protein